MRLGDFELHLLVAARMKFDGGLVFGVVPLRVQLIPETAQSHLCFPQLALSG